MIVMPEIKKQGYGSAPGKIILFGEHAVVYGSPAIAVAIDRHSFCQVSSRLKPGIELVFLNFSLRLEYPSLEAMIEQINPNYAQFSCGLKLLYDNYGLNHLDLRIQLVSSLWSNAGLGSSASIAVAYIAALGDFFGLNLKRQEINTLAFEMEKIAHGTPSGIDNAACCMGGMIYFSNGFWEKINLSHDFSFLIINSSEIHQTKDAVGKVANFRAECPELAQFTMNGIEKCATRAKKALEVGDATEIKTLIHQNQKLLENFGLSTPIMKKIFEIAYSHQIYGIKQTGAGMGGALIAYDAPNKLNELEISLNRSGFACFKVNIDELGVLNL
jgi:mevalonate kinase